MKIFNVPSSLFDSQHGAWQIGGHRGPYRRCLNFGHLGHIILVIDTVTQHVAEVPQCTLQSICCAFFLGLFKRCGLALAVLDMPVANILEEGWS